MRSCWHENAILLRNAATELFVVLNIKTLFSNSVSVEFEHAPVLLEPALKRALGRP